MSDIETGGPAFPNKGDNSAQWGEFYDRHDPPRLLWPRRLCRG